MPLPSRHVRRALPLAVAALLLAGCTNPPEPVPDDGSASPTPQETQEPPESPEPSESSSPAVDATAEAVVVEAEIHGIPVELAIGPVTRDGDLAVLRVTTTVTSGEETFHTGDLFRFVFNDISRVAPDALRLVDTAARTVALTAYTAGGSRAVEADDLFAKPGEGPAVFHAVFAAPSGDTTSVLIPHLGLVDDVPVVDAGPVSAADVAAVVDAMPGDLIAPLRPLDSYREIAEGQVRAREEDEQTTVGIATDVLFGVDSADLSPEADGALQAAGAQLGGATTGELVVVGHTDDVGTSEHNQDLSERRAQAVADRLAQLVDLSGFAVTVEGRGMSEPALPGTSEDARAANRRVELIFDSADEPSTATPAAAPEDGPLPETTGPVGTAADGVVVANSDDEVRITVERIRRIDRVLVGDLRLERTGGADGPVPAFVSQAAWDARGEFAPQLQFAATGVTLLVGDERVFPLDYLLDDEEDARRHPLAELVMTQSITVGGSDTVTVVWPDVGTESVTVDLPRISRGNVSELGAAWRITDVPVEDQ